MALTFYHVSWCPECALVREKLDELKLSYEDVVVPDFRLFRKQVFEVSGQYFVPVVKDGDTVLTETGEILAHLEERYGKTSEKSEHAATEGACRIGGTSETSANGETGGACSIGEMSEKGGERG